MEAIVGAKKRKSGLPPVAVVVHQDDKRPRVQAQRKFAQGQGQSPLSSANASPAKLSRSGTGTGARSSGSSTASGPVTETKPAPEEQQQQQCPKTEDFLTFLCLRGTSLLPPELDFFNRASLANIPDQSSGDENDTSENDKKKVVKKVKAKEVKKQLPPSVRALKKKYTKQRLARTVVSQKMDKEKAGSRRRRREQESEDDEEEEEEEVTKGLRRGRSAARLRRGSTRGRTSPAKVKSATKRPSAASIVAKRETRMATLTANSNRVSRMLTRLTPRGTSSAAFVKRAKKMPLGGRSLRGRDISVSSEEEKEEEEKKNKNENEHDADEENSSRESSMKRNVDSKKLHKTPVVVKKVHKRSVSRESSASKDSTRSDRPSRKTKEAATVYLNMLGQKLTRKDDKDDDNISIDSLTESTQEKRLEELGNKKSANLAASSKRKLITPSIRKKETDSKEEESDSSKKGGSSNANSKDKDNNKKKGKQTLKELQDRLLEEAKKKIASSPSTATCETNKMCNDSDTGDSDERITISQRTGYIQVKPRKSTDQMGEDEIQQQPESIGQRRLSKNGERTSTPPRKILPKGSEHLVIDRARLTSSPINRPHLPVGVVGAARSSSRPAQQPLTSVSLKTDSIGTPPRQVPLSQPLVINTSLATALTQAKPNIQAAPVQLTTPASIIMSRMPVQMPIQIRPGVTATPIQGQVHHHHQGVPIIMPQIALPSGSIIAPVSVASSTSSAVVPQQQTIIRPPFTFGQQLIQQQNLVVQQPNLLAVSKVSDVNKKSESSSVAMAGNTKCDVTSANTQPLVSPGPPMLSPQVQNQKRPQPQAVKKQQQLPTRTTAPPILTPAGMAVTSGAVIRSVTPKQMKQQMAKMQQQQQPAKISQQPPRMTSQPLPVRQPVQHIQVQQYPPGFVQQRFQLPHGQPFPMSQQQHQQIQQQIQQQQQQQQQMQMQQQPVYVNSVQTMPYRLPVQQMPGTSLPQHPVPNPQQPVQVQQQPVVQKVEKKQDKSKSIFTKTSSSPITTTPVGGKKPSSSFKVDNEASPYAFEPEPVEVRPNVPYRKPSSSSGKGSASAKSSSSSSLKKKEKKSKNDSLTIHTNTEDGTISLPDLGSSIPLPAELASQLAAQAAAEGPAATNETTYFIPLQSSSGQSFGVAVKLGTEGPPGPDQKVIMKAKLVTQPSGKPAGARVIGARPSASAAAAEDEKPQTSSRKMRMPMASPSSKQSSSEEEEEEDSDSSDEDEPKKKKPVKKKVAKKRHSSPEAKGGGGGKKSPKAKGSKKFKEETVPLPVTSPSITSRSTTQSCLGPIEALERFPKLGQHAHLVEAPVYRPTEAEFKDPLKYIGRIRKEAEAFGMCKIIPPSSFKPECNVDDDMRFTAYNQYVHKLMSRWGPNAREMAAIKKYLDTQNVTIKASNHPMVSGVEIDLPALYHAVQSFGGLTEVIQKKKWGKIAEFLRVPKGTQDRSNKFYDIYCKFLLPYDTLSNVEREELLRIVDEEFEERNREKLDRSKNEEEDDESESEEEEESEDEDNECVLKGKSTSLSGFFRVARNLMSMVFKNGGEPDLKDVEEEYWRMVIERDCHLQVQQGSIDTGTGTSGDGFGFPTSRSSSCGRHPWNLKILSNSPKSLLRCMGPVMGVTVPTLHVGMLFTTGCWYRDPHGLPWIEYHHTGAPKIWFGVPDSHSIAFYTAMKQLVPTFCRKKKIWLPSDTVMVPPNLLVKHGVSVCRSVQEAGQFIVVFPKSYTSHVCTGYTVSESVYFAPRDYLSLAETEFTNIRESKEPMMFPLPKLLLSTAQDEKTHRKTLRKVKPFLEQIRDNEYVKRVMISDLGVKSTERINLRSGSKKQQEEDEYECETCSANLYVSFVCDIKEDQYYCLDHAIKYLQNRKQAQRKNCKLLYTHSKEEVTSIIKEVNRRLDDSDEEGSSSSDDDNIPLRRVSELGSSSTSAEKPKRSSTDSAAVVVQDGPKVSGPNVPPGTSINVSSFCLVQQAKKKVLADKLSKKSASVSSSSKKPEKSSNKRSRKEESDDDHESEEESDKEAGDTDEEADDESDESVDSEATDSDSEVQISKKAIETAQKIKQESVQKAKKEKGKAAAAAIARKKSPEPTKKSNAKKKEVVATKKKEPPPAKKAKKDTSSSDKAKKDSDKAKKEVKASEKGGKKKPVGRRKTKARKAASSKTGNLASEILDMLLSTSNEESNESEEEEDSSDEAWK